MNWKYNSEETEVSDADVSGALAALMASSPKMSVGGGGNTIRVVENTVYYYGDVTESNALDLNSTLHAVDKKLQVSNQFLDINPAIKLHINSYGGSLFAGLATVDTIRSLDSEVHSIIDGAAASAATSAAFSSHYQQTHLLSISGIVFHEIFSKYYNRHLY